MKSNLPDGWESLTLGEVAKWSSGGTPQSGVNAYYGGDIPWVVIGDLNEGYVTTSAKTITELGLQKSSAKYVPIDSVMVAMYGASIGRLGIAAIRCTTNQAIAFTEQILPVTTTKYLFHYLSFMKDELVKLGQGGAQPNISQTILKTIPIPIAPLAEQQRIVAQLEAIIQKLEASQERLEKLPVLLKKFRKAVLAAAVSGKLTKAWRNENSVSETTAWKDVTLEALLEGKPRNGYSPQSVDFETPVKSLMLSATTTGRFRAEYFKYIDQSIPSESHLWLRPDDILVQRANSLEYVGISAMYQGPLNTFIYPDLMMKCRANEKALPKFLHYVLLSEPVRRHFRENATGTAGNMPKINQQTVLNAPVSLPELEEQREIVRQVNHYFSLAEQLEARFEQAAAMVEQLPQALLAKAFSGQLVSQDPNDEPASALLERLRATTATPAKVKRGRKPKVVQDAPLFE